MATKRKPSQPRGRKSKKNWSTGNFVLIVLMLLVVSIVFSYFFFYNKDSQPITEKVSQLFTSSGDSLFQLSSPKDMQENPKEQTSETAVVEKTPLEGTWVSTLNGAMLTFQGSTFQIEFPSIEERPELKGHFRITEDNIHLVNTLSDDLCGMKEGVYSFTIKGEDLILETVKEPCSMRKENLETAWFKL
ncbi:MAG: hypothetical protein KJ578_09425 [Bacteroidetes bacterium]|nr:hypothetical protein [Bacteroidota bacterium]MBU1579230.1 hypothetical protein [Bacteroidota bacterium]MBU2465923.1 hypothetical protein [Bacteroidota bacterium]MBU2557983.1 hypothetical protein [Bacteroidota bacterium]